jgi:hypothetical protein
MRTAGALCVTTKTRNRTSSSTAITVILTSADISSKHRYLTRLQELLTMNGQGTSSRRLLTTPLHLTASITLYGAYTYRKTVHM